MAKRRNVFIGWAVFDPGPRGTIWLSTCAMTRKFSIRSWLRQMTGRKERTWRYWSNRGFRCHRVEVKAWRIDRPTP